MDENIIDSIVFKQWVSVDTSTLKTDTKPGDEFVESFWKKLELLLPHSFITMQQTSLYKDRESTLQPGELLVTANLSENYSFVLQNKAQLFHWTSPRPLSILFCLLHWIWGAVSSELCGHIRLSAAWYSCCSSVPKRLIAYLRRKLSSNPQKVTIFGWSSIPVRKSQEFHQIARSSRRFWSGCWKAFSATSPGKGSCDGLCGTALVARASLQRQ